MELMPPDGVPIPAESLTEVTDPPKRTMTLRVIPRHASDSPDEQLVGNIVGFDGRPEEINLLTDEEYEDQFKDRANLPWYVVGNVYDVDRVVAARLATLRHDEYMLSRYAERVKAGRQRILDLVNYYADLIPAPVPDKDGKTPSSKQTKGKYSGLLYVNNPNRLASIELVDKQAAQDAGLANEVMVPVIKTLPMEKLRAKLDELGNLPGFRIETPDPISVNLREKE